MKREKRMAVDPTTGEKYEIELPTPGVVKQEILKLGYPTQGITIKEDRLGLDVIYVQAKRWKGNVGEPPIRDFVGALDGKGVQKGILITTSNFNPAATNFAERSSKRIVLINGTQLAQLMIEHNVGVSTVETYEIKRVDSDYFIQGVG